MASENEGIEVPVGADLSELISGLAKGLESVNGFARGVEGSFKGLGHALEAMKGPLIAFTAILAGGKLFKESIEATKEWVDGVKKLSFALGVSLEDASAYSKVLTDVGVSTETAVGIAQRLTMTVQRQEERWNQAGVAVRDATTGKMRPAAEIMTALAERANGLTNEGEKQRLLSYLLGRSWMSFSGILKVTEERVKEAREELKTFGITVDKDAKEKVTAYEEAMRQTGDAMEAVKVRIGMMLMPALTDLAKTFSKLALDVFPYVSQALEGLGMSFSFLVYVVKMAWATLKELFNVIGYTVSGFAALYRAVEQAASGNFSGAWRGLTNSLSLLWEEAKRDAVQYGKDISGAADEFAAKIMGAYERLLGKAPKKKPKAETGGEGEGFVEDDSKRLMEGAKREEIARMDEYLQAGLKMSVEEELAFWSVYLDIARAGGARYREAYQQLVGRIVGLQEQRTKEVMASEKAEADLGVSLTYGAAERKLEAASAYYARVNQMYASDSEEVQAAYRSMLEAGRAYNDEVRDLAESRRAAAEERAAAAVDMEATAFKLQVDLGIRSQDEMLAADQAFEDRRYQIKKAGLEARLQLENLTPQQRQEIQNQLEAAEQAHEAKLLQIHGDGMRQYAEQARAFLEPVRAAFSDLFNTILTGQMKFRDVMMNLWKGVASTVSGALSKILTDAIASNVAQKLSGSATAVSVITQDAGKAAAGAAASQADIPVVGPALAASAFASTMALVLSALPMAAAARGYDIGNDNPIVQLHKREMVLPESLAEGVRDMSRGGGAASVRATAALAGRLDGIERAIADAAGRPQGSMSVAVNLTLQSPDGAGAYRLFKEQEAHLIRVITEAVSNGRLRLQPSR